MTVSAGPFQRDLRSRSLSKLICRGGLQSRHLSLISTNTSAENCLYLSARNRISQASRSLWHQKLNPTGSALRRSIAHRPMKPLKLNLTKYDAILRSLIPQHRFLAAHKRNKTPMMPGELSKLPSLSVDASDGSSVVLPRIEVQWSKRNS